MDAYPIDTLHERYKTGHRRVKQWLAEKARGTRKTSSAEVMDIDKMGINETERLAAHIVGTADKKKALPDGIDGIIIILETVVAGRAEAGVVTNMRTPRTPEEQSKDGHQYCLLSLRRVLSVLKQIRTKLSHFGSKQAGRCKGKKHKYRRPVNAHISNDVMTNIYQSLEVEDLSTDDELEKSSTEDLATTVGQMSIAGAGEPLDEPDTSSEEQEFALWCLLKECHELRKHLRDIWTRYHAGKVSIRVAADVTERAFTIIHNAFTAYVQDFPTLSTFEDIAEYLDLGASVQGSSIDSFRYKGSATGPDEAQALELLCIPAFLGLTLQRQHELQLVGDAFKRDGQLDVADWLENSHELNRKVSDMHTEKTFMDHDLFREFSDLFGPDIFTMLVLPAISDTKLKISTVVIYQIYMDIVDITQYVIASSLKAILGTSGCISQSLVVFEESMPNLGLAFRKKFLASELRNTFRKRKDVLDKVLHIEDSSNHLAKVTDYPFPVAFPVLAGGVTNRLMLSAYADGIMVCDEDAIVMSVATLYEACRRCRLLPKPWKDMDFFIQSMGTSALGLHNTGASRTPILSMAKNYGLALGVPAKSYSKESIAKRKNEPRAPLPSANQIDGRRVRLRDNSLLVLANQKAYEAFDMGLSNEQAYESSLHWLVTQILDDPHSITDAALLKRWQACRRLDSRDTLVVIEQRLQEEELAMLFDRHSHATNCAATIAFLKSIFSPMRSSRPRLASRLSQDYTVHQLVDEILWEAAELERRDTKIYTREGKLAWSETGLGCVAGFFIEHIIPQGDDLCKRAVELRNDQCCNAEKETTAIRRAPRAQRIAEGTSMAMAGAQVDFQSTDLTAGEKKKRAAMRRHADVLMKREMQGVPLDVRLSLFRNEWDAEEAAVKAAGGWDKVQACEG